MEGWRVTSEGRQEKANVYSKQAYSLLFDACCRGDGRGRGRARFRRCRDLRGPHRPCRECRSAAAHHAGESRRARQSAHERGGRVPDLPEIGRASCRARVCQYVENSGVAEKLKKKKHKET